MFLCITLTDNLHNPTYNGKSKVAWLSIQMTATFLFISNTTDIIYKQTTTYKRTMTFSHEDWFLITFSKSLALLFV